MANLLVAFDQDLDRRSTYIENLKKTIAPFPGLQVDGRDASNCSVVWAISSSAPLNVLCDARGLAVVLGEAIDESGKRQSAAQVRSAWDDKAATVWDGFYAAIAVGANGELTVGVDLLGLFPLYYWQGSGVTLVGTSPELFLSHPAFSAGFHLEGLVRVLLVNGLVGGQTLLKDVRRLQPGCHLASRNGRLEEFQAYRIPEGLDLAHLPLEGHVAALGENLKEAVRRHAPHGPRYGMLLSGGLDSRMVGGLLVDAGITPRALSIGLAQDLEMRCAKAAAHALGVEQITAEPKSEEYPELARIHADFEHLANGFNTIRDWWTQSQVGQLGDRIATGLIADAMVGGTAIHWAYTPSPPKMSFDGYWKNMPQLGIPSDILRDLLQSPHRGLVDSAMDEIRKEYDGYGELGSYRAWRFDIAHGERFHVGATLWRLAFGAWPTLPMLDRRVIKVASSIPAASLAHRVTQLEFVKTYLPRLGNVPLDRSDLLEHQAQYITPRLRDLMEERLRKEIARVRRRISGRETRYWYRVNAFHSDAWRSVRRVVEPNRSKVEPYLDPSTLKDLLPSPDADHSLVSESGRKLLVGFIHWASNHL
jgi:asparagine synthase (glutamine-hydrolysing)